MSLKNTPQGQHNTQMGEAFGTARQGGGTQQQQSDQDMFSLSSMGSLFDLPAAADSQSEVLTKAVNALTNDIKQNQDPAWDISVEGLDRENSNLNIGVSIVLIVARSKRQPAAGIGYHALLLSASAPEPGTRTVSLPGNRQVETREVTGDLFDDVMQNEIVRELDRRYNGAKIFSGDGQAVRAAFDWDDASAVKRLRTKAVTAAAMSLITGRDDFVDINLAKVRRDPTLSIATLFKQPQIIDGTGLPKRADVRIRFRAGTPQSQQNQQGNSANLDKQKDLSEIGGYIDLIHNRQQNVNPFAPTLALDPQAAVTAAQQFMARFVITSLQSTRAPTLSQTLLSLMTVYAVRRPYAWYPAFEPNYRAGRENEVDIQDVGVIGLEAAPDPTTGIGQRVKTKTESFTKQHLGLMLNAWVKPGLIVSMDVEECGEDTWRTKVFAQAAQQKDPEAAQQAYDAIYDAADWLMDTNFSKVFARGEPIVIYENNRIQNFVYPGQNGELRDGRDLDLVAMYNLMGERDIKVARDWNDSFLLADFPIDMRLDARLQTAQQMMPDLKLVGYSNRITFTSKFLEALTKAAEMTNHLQIREVNNTADAAGMDSPQYQFAAQALGGFHASNVFTQAGVAYGGGNQQRSTGRW